MIRAIRRIEGVGRYESAAPAKTPFSPFTLIYGENGRGKTTLATIFASLARNDPARILARRRLGAERPPRIEIRVDDAIHLFDEDHWARPCADLRVFDDNFVDENIYSGLEVETTHARNLHGLIIGAEGVSLNAALHAAIAAVEEQNRVLKKLEAEIPAHLRGGATVEAFCALERVEDVDGAILEAERASAAAMAAEELAEGPLFEILRLPPLDGAAIEALLSRGLPALESAAAEAVRAQADQLGDGGEIWLAEGARRARATGGGACPYCAQDLANSRLIGSYQSYFSDAYAALKAEIEEAESAAAQTYGPEISAAAARALSTALKVQIFWRRFAEPPEIGVEAEPIIAAVRGAREALLRLLRAKRAAPLEPVEIDAPAREAFALYADAEAAMAALAGRLTEANAALVAIREGAPEADAAALDSALQALIRAKRRHAPPLAEPCDAYLAALAEKKRLEAARGAAREALDHYQLKVFPSYERAINAFLKRFNASYTLGDVGARNTRAGASFSYKMLINKAPVSLSAKEGPSFRNTLSAGDRNTLALAFFFASLELDPQRKRRIVVIDDPMSSLDEHRTLATRQEIRKLADMVRQVIVLSHDKTFLYGLWEAADREKRCGVQVRRVRNASTLAPWDVTSDMVTEHDKRHALIRAYMDGKPSDERAVAGALRPTLETFLRAAYPLEFPAGSMIGQFLKTCRKKARADDPVLSSRDMEELRNILDYANSFHHDTNRACDRETINDAELYDFVLRTVSFTRRDGG